MYDEPFGDSSQIPTYLVAKLARTKVTVSLSGDGGDELFGGYNRYFWAERYWARMRAAPGFVRTLGAAGVRALPPAAWDTLWKGLPRRAQLAQPGDKLYKLADLAKARDGRQAYAWLIAQHRERESLILGAEPPAPAGAHALWDRPGRRLADNMMLADARGYLPDDILAKVDRATMAVGLEGRAPFLDHRVVEFAFRLPTALKIRGGVGKWLLREVLYRHVPRALIERPKMGFGVPIDAWLRGPLKAWAEDLLDPSRLENEGFLRVAPIRLAWAEHLSGRRNLQHFLWNILMFEAWLQENKTR
jgi:asparagine synthase (glutamine-hydrolysing)